MSEHLDIIRDIHKWSLVLDSVCRHDKQAVSAQAYAEISDIFRRVKAAVTPASPQTGGEG